jgi:preflagellin peptidase FlaK
MLIDIDLDLMRIAICTPFLIYSCISDWKTRRVSNNVWLSLAIFAAIFAFLDLINIGLLSLLKLCFSTALIFFLAYILFQLHAFGGADAKALIAISLLIPSYPILRFNTTVLPLSGTPLLNLFALSTFGNAVILTIVVPFALLIHNLRTLSLQEIKEKPFYLFIGYKCRVTELANKHLRLIENHELIGGKLVKKFKRGGIAIDQNTIKHLEELVREGKISDRVWVTPGLPFMLSITAGFFTAIIYGDILFTITRAIT